MKNLKPHVHFLYNIDMIKRLNIIPKIEIPIGFRIYQGIVLGLIGIPLLVGIL